MKKSQSEGGMAEQGSEVFRGGGPGRKNTGGGIDKRQGDHKNVRGGAALCLSCQFLDRGRGRGETRTDALRGGEAATAKSQKGKGGVASANWWSSTH